VARPDSTRFAPDRSTVPPLGDHLDAVATADPAGPSTSPVPAVDMRGISKRFGPVPALSALDLSVPGGRITVLLGPNGAGKTTAIRIITGALEPDQGSVRTFGLDPARHGEDIRRRCGVVSAKPALYDRLSGWDNLRYSAELYGLGRHATGRIRDAAGRFGIADALDQKVGGFSTGMKTRLALARSVLHDPELLLFDEPTSGLDPESSKAVLELIREMTAGGRTVVMCTHLLIEAEGLADQIIVLESGTDLLHGSQEELIRRYWPNRLVWFDAEEPSQLDLLRGLPGVVGVTRGDAGGLRSRSGAGHVASGARRGRARCQVEIDDARRVPDLLAVLVERGVRVTRVEPHMPTLEELYFAVRAERRAPNHEHDAGEVR
jgi:ABC-2 type transport system ATP-binding protein